MASPASVEVIVFGEFQANLRSRELWRKGVKVRLPDQSFQVLAMLLEHPGELVTRDEIRQRLWPGDTFVDFDHGLNNAVNRLREALGDSADSPRFVETLPRRGYRFIGAPNGLAKQGGVAEAEAPAAFAAEIPARPAEAPKREQRRLPYVWVGVAIAAILLVALPALIFRAKRGAESAPIRSLAVLPLENLSGDASQEYFADGMTDSLITNLARISSLRVISRTSVMTYKGARKPLAEIARELNVDAIVEGSVVRSGNRVRINAQLIQATPERHLWANSYERDLADLVALQGDVARAIAGEIQIKLTPQDQARLTTIRPANAEAYEAYLRGRFYWSKRTVEALQIAKAYFEEAVQKDPQYALAYSGLADTYDVLGSGVAVGLPPQEAFRKATEAATKALQLDENLGEAHTALGGIKFSFDWDWEGAEREFRRAIELNPNDVTAHFWHAQLMVVLARWDDALVSADRAAHLDPVAPIIATFRGSLFRTRRQYDKALDLQQKALSLDPNYFLVHYDLGLTYEQMGQYQQAVSELQKALELSGGDLTTRASLAHVYAVCGRKAEAESILNELKQQAKGSNLSYQIADVYVGLGRKEQAFQWLEKAYQERSGWLTWIAVEPKLDPLRSDARFADLLHRMRLPP